MSSSSSSSSQPKTLRIGIIGFGPFAQFLAKTMMKQGHFIRVTSRSDYSELCTNLGILFFRYGYIDNFLMVQENE
uniref:Prephenate dehydrogenase n=1 Tax=Solanum tuberosum TaxID=4113 RepID=M1C7P1_SOLTU